MKTVILAATREQGRYYARRERAGDERGTFYTADTNLHGLMLGPEDTVLICPGAWRHPKYADHLHYLAHVIAKGHEGPKVRYLAELDGASREHEAWQLAHDAELARAESSLATARDELSGVKAAHAREMEVEREVAAQATGAYLRMKTDLERTRAHSTAESFRRMEAELRLRHVQRLIGRIPAPFVAKHLVARLVGDRPSY